MRTLRPRLPVRGPDATDRGSNFEALLAELGVASQPSHMGFSVSDGSGRFEYSLMPRRRPVRASWNFHLSPEPSRGSTVTYWMNNLPRLRAEETYLVTLNRGEAIDPAKTIRRIQYDHPMYTAAGIAAQARHAEVSGVRPTHYCGAYWGWGFHEDGVVSALRACARIPGTRTAADVSELTGPIHPSTSDTPEAEPETLAA